MHHSWASKCFYCSNSLREQTHNVKHICLDRHTHFEGTRRGRHTGSAAELELVPNPSTMAWEKPFRTAQGLLRVQPHRAAGKTSPPCRASPSRTVTTHNPSAPRVLPKSHALQMLAAIRDAIPRGEVQRTAVTILPITMLKTCINMQHSSGMHSSSRSKETELCFAVAVDGRKSDGHKSMCHDALMSSPELPERHNTMTRLW